MVVKYKWALVSGKMAKTPKRKRGYVLASTAAGAKAAWCRKHPKSNKCPGGAKKRKAGTRKAGAKRYRKDFDGKSCRGRSKNCGKHRYVLSGGKAVRNSKAAPKTYVLAYTASSALPKLKAKFA